LQTRCPKHADTHPKHIVIARLDRTTQYAEASMMNKNIAEHWITRFRG
jgi:hypothetical protein